MINYSQGSSSYASHGNLCSQAQRFILFAEAHQAEASRRTDVTLPFIRKLISFAVSLYSLHLLLYSLH